MIHLLHNPRHLSACRRIANLLPSRRRFTTNDTNPPPPPPSSGAVHLTTRRLISIQGQDAPKFLQGLITNNVDPSSRRPFFTAFLTAQGRVLNDAFVFPTLHGSESGYILDVDAGFAPLVTRQIKKHKLRAKFSVRLLEPDEGSVWSLWRAGDKWTPHPALGDGMAGDDGIICLTDTRATSMGKRVLVTDTSGGHILPGHPAFEGLEQAPLSAYTIRRYLRGVVEGHDEIPPDTTLPMNMNLDTMHAIDFRKGCYLGQELTIRTHHTGVVRKRVLPVALYPLGQDPPPQLEYTPNATIARQPRFDADIKSGTHRRKPGSYIAGIGNIGLAMCRLESMTDLAVTPEPSPYSPQDRFTVRVDAIDGQGEAEYGVQAFVPDWLRGRVRTATPQKRIEA